MRLIGSVFFVSIANYVTEGTCGKDASEKVQSDHQKIKFFRTTLKPTNGNPTKIVRQKKE